ncbi:MAG TPA: HAMP domain-containing sensor histidine kinase, partial [Candidatus Polarisedimenticolia bacterium]|nr:HAMP domain-containing sensor histidine kinase [Candidatus Polarisedimenticolia bacterium]
LSTVGRMAAGMAHEINNPLEGMSNYLVLAREALARQQLDEAQRCLAKVREGLDRAAGVVRQVLAHADPAHAPAALVDLVPTILQTVEFVRSRPEFKSIRFEVDLPEALSPIRGRPVMLGQVFLNLLLNACEAQPDGGEVTVTGDATGGFVHVEISDRGPGIPKADADRIFEPFYTTKRSTGLGLSICHSIVREHGGEISAVNRKEGGASFKLRFPAGPA